MTRSVLALALTERGGQARQGNPLGDTSTVKVLALLTLRLRRSSTEEPQAHAQRTELNVLGPGMRWPGDTESGDDASDPGNAESSPNDAHEQKLP
ncbi:hypothetical protein [Streptomyces sp. NPDC005046]